MTEQARAVFDEHVIGAIATVNHDGSPWVTPLHMVADDEYVYWFSKETAVHSQNISRDSRVSLSLFSPDDSSGRRGVYINGSATLLVDDDDQHAREVLTARTGVPLEVFANDTAYRLPLGQFDKEKSTGRCWYFYS